MDTTTLQRNDSAIVHDPWEKTSKVSVAEYQTHPLKDFISRAVEEYVLESWHFEENNTNKQAFLLSGVSGIACDYFPSALDERIGLVARLFAVLYLIAGKFKPHRVAATSLMQSLDSLSSFDAEDGEEYIEALEAATRGYWMPDEQVSAVWMLCGIFDEMRTIDYIQVDDVMETTLAHLRAGLFRRGRSAKREDGGRSGFRIGAALVSALSTFAMGVDVDDSF